uniref:Orf13 n=1 Tax=Staphylococcus aureus TaxID=1280 RepID=Q8VLX2_STAAU|nr:orf13 [Staphylococcus aureus]
MYLKKITLIIKVTAHIQVVNIPMLCFGLGGIKKRLMLSLNLKKTDVLRWIFVSQLFIWLMVKVWICLL